jgi:hypothetical protein
MINKPLAVDFLRFLLSQGLALKIFGHKGQEA